VTERLRKRGPACIAAGGHVVPGVDVAAALSSILVVVMAVVLRLRYFSGLGLGDDLLLRSDIVSIVQSGHVINLANGYRFTWWIPTALSCRLLGLTEAGLIAPIVAFDVLGMVLVCLFARRLWGGGGAVIAALLLAVLPLDVAWSTMLASDILLSFFSALCVFFVVRALGEDDVARRGRAWMLAAVALWLAYHAKVSGVLLVPALAVIGWANRRALDATVFRFLGMAALLFGGSCLVFYVRHGDALAPFNAELSFQGLIASEAPLHRASLETWKIFPRWLFLPGSLGTWVYSVYPHLLIVLAVAGAALGVRPCWPLLWWLFFVFLGMELNLQRLGGVWVAGFRNVRHGHVFAYPLVLLLTGYLVAFRRRYPKATDGLLLLVLGFSLWQSVATATITHVAFGDERSTTRFLATLPQKPTYSDFQLGQWFTFSGLSERGWQFHVVDTDRDKRRRELGAVTSGYLVTGGGREPYYGCTDCIPRADDVRADRWVLLKEFPSSMSATSWRAEPLRVWEARAAP